MTARTLLTLCIAVLFSSMAAYAQQASYRDPVHDGAADPFVIRSHDDGRWYMFYTGRRADLDGCTGVEWAHGTSIGIAVSDDLKDWEYLRDAVIDEELGGKYPTLWAPCVVDDGMFYHMFLTCVPGIFPDWEHPRSIAHLISLDLVKWIYTEEIPLGSDRVIDAEVVEVKKGLWRMWYNIEPEGKLIASADSRDLYRWKDNGPVTCVGGGTVRERKGEGPVRTIAGCEGPSVFRWKGRWWLVCDEWKGLAVYSSRDARNWVRQPGNILEDTPDGDCGRHCDVVVSGNNAYIFFFTHPGAGDGSRPEPDVRRSVIRMTGLGYSRRSHRASAAVFDLQP